MDYIEIDGKQIKPLFTLNINNVDYMVYEVDGDLSASRYKLEGMELELDAITDEEEWKLVEEKINATMKAAENAEEK